MDEPRIISREDEIFCRNVGPNMPLVGEIIPVHRVATVTVVIMVGVSQFFVLEYGLVFLYE